jgi:hypothetical protein
MFKVGDRAVYPAQGVGVIEAIETALKGLPSRKDIPQTDAA